MPKWKAHYDGARKYLPEWETEFPWLQKDDKEGAICKLCRKSLRCKKFIILQHSKSSGHIIKETATNSCKSVAFFMKKSTSEDEALKKAELQLAASISCHCSISSIDHIGEIIQQYSKGSVLEKLKMHRTKCSRLISEVLSVELKNELRDDLEGKKYSILMDETTDISSEKKVCLCIKYFSEKHLCVEDQFLGLVSVTETTGEALFNAMQTLLHEFNLNLKDCVGFGTDGANNMTGENNSVWSRIKQTSPNCVKMQCVCHSLALCVKKAFEILPSHLGFLMTEIPSWFKKSSERRGNFKKIFDTININEERQGVPLPFKKLSVTRWLVRGVVIYNILINWLELKTFFISEKKKCVPKGQISSPNYSGNVRG